MVGQNILSTAIFRQGGCPVPARLVIVTERPSSEPNPLTAAAEALATGIRGFGLVVDVVQHPFPTDRTADHALPDLPLADAYWHVGLTALAADTVMQARRRQRPVLVHAVGDELETTIHDWQSSPWIQLTIAGATRLSAGSARARRLLAPFHAHDVCLLPTIPAATAESAVTDRRHLRHALGLPPDGLLIGVFDPPAADIMSLLLTTFSEFWDSRQDAWLLVADNHVEPAAARAAEQWARQDYQPARRVIWRQPEPLRSSLDVIPACDQVWSLSADHGPSPAVQAALRASVPVVASTRSGQDPLSGQKVQDRSPTSHVPAGQLPPFAVPQEVESLVFAALCHAADPARTRERTAALQAALPDAYRPEGLMTALRDSLADLGLLGDGSSDQTGNNA
jgi:hypothetical protein